MKGEKKFIFGKIVSLDRSNPTFPNEAAAELTGWSIRRDYW